MSKMAEQYEQTQVLKEHHAYILMLETRIRELEVALGKIAGWPSSCEDARNIARAALVGKLP